MSGYLVGFWLSYAASVVVFWGLIALAVLNWLFGGTPVWFYVLCVIGVSLPFLSGGEITGRRMKRGMAKPWRGLLTVLALSLLVGMTYAFLPDSIAVFVCPGTLFASALDETAGIHDGEVITLLAQLLFGLIFHLGWKTGQRDIK